MKGHYKIVYLETTTYKGGPCYWATHYYGRLVSDDGDLDHVDLEFTLSASQAEKMTAGDEGYTYREGDHSMRFESEDAVIALALATYKQHFPEADILVLGCHSTCEPRPILDGPSPLKEQVTAMYEKCEKLGWWDGENEAKCLRIDKEWQALMGFKYQ